MQKHEITQITLYREIGGDNTAYEATITINDSFVVQVWGNADEASPVCIPYSDTAYHRVRDDQDAAQAKFTTKEIENILEEVGFENNLGWLEDHADSVF